MKYLLLYQKGTEFYPITVETDYDGLLDWIPIKRDIVVKEIIIPYSVMYGGGDPDRVYKEYFNEAIIFDGPKRITNTRTIHNYVSRIEFSVVYADIDDEMLLRMVENGWQEVLLEHHGYCLVKEINNGL